MKLKKLFARLLSVFLVAVLCFNVFSFDGFCLNATWEIPTSYPDRNSSAWQYYSAPKNTYPLSPYNQGNCTWYAFGRAYEVSGKDCGLGAAGDAGNWYTYAKNKGMSVGTEAKAGAIICWSTHVAFVEKVEGNTVTWSESNYQFYSNVKLPKFNLYSSSHPETYCSKYGGVLLGYIYIDICKHKYNSDYLCSSCNAVNPDKITSMTPTSYIVVSDSPLCRIAPYNTFNDNTVRLKKDDIVTVTGKITNSSNKLWYRLSDGRWIYSEHIKPFDVTYTDIADGYYRIKNVATGKYLIVDAGNGANGTNVSVWELNKDAAEEKWNILEDSLGFKIHTALSSGRVLNSYGTSVKAGNNVNIWNFIANDATQRWKFQKVSGGYVIRNVSVPSCVLSVGSSDNNVSMQTFVSGDKKQIWSFESATECSHSYNGGKITKAATCTNAGVKTYTCTKCGATKTEAVSATGHNYGNWTVAKAATCIATGTEKRSCSGCGNAETRSIAKTNHKYKSKTIAPTCVDYEKVQYTCEICNHTYYEYSSDKYSSWSTTKPTGVDEALVESKTQYRYSDYEKITSAESSLSGYTKLGYTWEKTNSGTVQYVKNWPSGFSTSHSLYSKYNKTPKTAYENATNQVTVKEATVSGYLYYHWCRGTYENGPKNRKSTPEYTSECNAFHAFFSTTSPSGLTAAGDGSYSYSNGNCCKDSYWYYYIPVYSQTYSEYEKLFTYERWTNWSEWSDTVYTSDTNKKVETRTLYRYPNGQLGSHAYDNGIVSKEATCTETGVKTYTCTKCDTKKTETIAAKGHKEEVIIGKAATCTERGWSSGTKCSVCNKVLSGYEVLSETGHNWVCDVFSTDEYCTKCGTRRPGAHNPVEEENPTLPEKEKLPAADSEVTLGDVDEDGQITASDARLALRASVGLEKLGDKEVYAADVDADGKITASDARKILRIAVGLDKN